MEYSKGFRAAMVRRMTGPNAKSAGQLAAEVKVCQPTLSRWLREAGSVQEMSKQKRRKPPSRWTAAEKLRVVASAQGLTGEELGALLRREGIHSEQLEQWRKAAEVALDPRAAAKVGAEHVKQLKELRRELARKDRALAEATARLVLRKKMTALWGEEDDDTEPTSGE